ncbi:hypothetical protein HK098_006285 [Nowakowskiella sp. JEL0407]|nr:hypothetical protein HK098_006285 [Nowakowskiella sp. JEL0407]
MKRDPSQDPSQQLSHPDKRQKNQPSNLPDLLEWGNKHNSKLPFNLTSNRIPVATITTDATEPMVLEIPHNLILSKTNALKYESGKKLWNALENSGEYRDLGKDKDPFVKNVFGLGLFIIYEKFENESSHFGPYLWTLPSDIPLPLSWPPELVHRELRGTNLEHIVTERQKQLKKLYRIAKIACGHLFKKKGSLSLENIIWAYSVIASRAFPEKKVADSEDDRRNSGEENGSDGGDATEFMLGNPRNEECDVCLWPILDMLDHKPNHKVEWRTTKSGVSLVFQDPIQAGDTLYNNYGPKGNENFLSNYGFCLSPNTSDYVKLKLSSSLFSPSDESQEHEEMDTSIEEFTSLKFKLLESLGIEFTGTDGKSENRGSNSRIFMLFINDPVPAEFVVAMRILLLKKHEVAKTKEIYGIGNNEQEKYEVMQTDLFTKIVSKRNEVVTWMTLISLLEKKVSVIDYDVGSEDEELDLKVKFARIYRLGQLRILKDALQFCESHLCIYLTSLGLADPNEQSAGWSQMLEKAIFHIQSPKMIEILDILSEFDLDEDTLLSIGLCWYKSFGNTERLWKEFMENGRNVEASVVLGVEIKAVEEHYEDTIKPVLSYITDSDIETPTRIRIELLEACSLENFLWAASILDMNSISYGNIYGVLIL